MDIDIDLPSTFEPSDLFAGIVPATVVNKKGEITKHAAGHYFQSMPINPISGTAAIPYKDAERYGFFKIDFLHLSLLDNFKSKQEIRALMKIEPNWDLLLYESTYTKLFQLGRYFSLVSTIKPTSLPEVADCVALIRPGKSYIQSAYVNASERGRVALRQELYAKPDTNVYYFKKSHAHAYAANVILNLHLIEAGLI